MWNHGDPTAIGGAWEYHDLSLLPFSVLFLRLPVDQTQLETRRQESLLKLSIDVSLLGRDEGNSVEGGAAREAEDIQLTITAW